MVRQSGLRELTRRAVRREIAEAAERLFIERGYEATTISDVAAAVGMSQRSVFRYFATKEELLIGKFELVGDDLLAALRERPAGEPVWTSLRHMFLVLGPLAEDPVHSQFIGPMQRVVFETPTLFASYLLKMHELQESVVAVLEERAGAKDPALPVLTAAAFGCLVAALQAWLAAPEKTTVTEAITWAMASLIPTTG